MAYQSVPRLPEPGGSAAQSADAAIRALLVDIAGRKEFNVGRATESPQGTESAATVPGFGLPGSAPSRETARLFLPGLRLHGAQLFVRNFENPDTEYTRLLAKWQTGTGKSHAAASIAHEFMRSFRARAAIGEQPPAVTVISFTARETIQAELLRHPEYGFVSQVEVEELRRLRAATSAAGPGSPEDRQLSSYVGVLRRRITDRTRGGYYEFYGYKEFANRLFIVGRAAARPGRGSEAAISLSDLFGRGERLEGESFGERLARAVRQGEIRVNEDLLNTLRRGLLICDEIHNVYNILEANNYGIAIQYALDTLGDEAPRALFMSATPMTGSAAEVVDLLNFLVPRSLLPGGMPLRRSDFFTRAASPPAATLNEAGVEEVAEDSGFIVSQLREGAIERIGRLAAGRVSFLLDADVGSYPRRIFEGEEQPGVPYLRLTLCPMSPFHERTLAREQSAEGRASPDAPGGRRAEAAGLAPGAYTLYDMAFPNPDFAPDAAETDPKSYGMYRSGETPARLAGAPEDWRSAAGVVIERGAEAGVMAGTYVISGSFLELERLPLYGRKPAAVVAAALAALRAGPGKITIYHHRVRMSGVLLYQEALRMNGFTDETSSPTDTTICAVCGVARGEHAGMPRASAPGSLALPTHAYTPARFVMAHSDVDRSNMLRSLARYNSPTNTEGYQYRVLIGSRIIRESHSFRAVRHLLVASLPVDYPTLLQVFGRVDRKESHAELPVEQRDVRIRVFVSTYADGRVSPELQRYIDKGREYLVIQEVERALHVYAVDGFANYQRIRTALNTGPGGELRQSLDALPYSPLVGPEYSIGGPAWVPGGVPGGVTFEAYGHGEREVAIIAAVCRVLFRARPVWKYEDLWAAVGAGAVQGVNYDARLFSEGNFALALSSLARPAGEPPEMVVQVGGGGASAARFYVRAAARPDGSAAIDVESYVRAPLVPVKVSIRLADYLRDAKSGQNFAVRLREYEREYLSPGVESRPLELSLVEYGASFHYALLRRLVLATDSKVTRDDGRVRELYRRFRVAVTVADATGPAVARVYRGPPTASASAETIIGYITPDAVALYGPREEWYNASHADFSIGRRHRENDIVVGFVVSVGETRAPDRSITGDPFSAFAAASAEARFKIRPPIQKLRTAKSGDVRTLARGAVCETRPREELESFAEKLRRASAGSRRAQGGSCGCGAPLASGGLSLQPAVRQLHYAARFDPASGKRFPSAGETCDAIRIYLLELEEAARAPVNGMMDGVRWIYLFHDRPPTISALAGAPGEDADEDGDARI